MEDSERREIAKAVIRRFHRDGKAIYRLPDRKFIPWEKQKSGTAIPGVTHFQKISEARIIEVLENAEKRFPGMEGQFDLFVSRKTGGHDELALYRLIS